MSAYFDVVIRDNSFYIVESGSKPQNRDSALKTLEKIELIVRKELAYDSNHSDDYSNKTREAILNLLKDKSLQIHNGYSEKASKLNRASRKIFSKEKEINAIHKRIDDLIQAYQALKISNELSQSVPDEITLLTAQFLEFSDLEILSELSSHGKSLAETAMIRKAREFGYEGDNHEEAVKYINDLFNEINDLCKQGVIQKKHLHYKNNSEDVDSEKVLLDLQDLSTEDLFSILSNERLYSPEFQKVRKIFGIKGNWEVVKNDSDLIKQKGSAALALSAKNGDKGIAALLLQHGADPNLLAQNGSSPLHWAAQASNADIVELLLEHGADPNIPAKNGSPPLHWAAQAGHADIVALLLKRGAKVNTKAGGHNTALAYACGWGDRTVYRPNPKVVELLLQNGADPNIPAKNGSSPLQWAAQAGNEDIVALLLKYGAAVNAVSDSGNTALAYACGSGHSVLHCYNLKVIKLLLERGADPNIPAHDERFPLDLAAQAGHADIVELLLKNGAKVNAISGSNTALAYACGWGDRTVYRPNLEVIKLLLKRGADPNLPTYDGRFPLDLATQAGHADIVELLLKVNTQTGGHNTVRRKRKMTPKRK